MKTKHTKAPWLITTIQGEDCLMVGGGDGSEVVADIRTDWPEEEVESNARLIAAAPELLEALEGLANCAGLTWLNGYKDELDAAMTTARAAIARAKGGDR